jgi:two-component system CheB/CheR fusion protein
MENFVFEDPCLSSPSIYSIGTDVTDLMEATEAAEDAYSQLMLLQDHAQIGNWSLDLENKSITWSEEVFRIHGMTIEDGMPNYEDAIAFYHPDDRKMVEQHIDTVAREGGQFQFNVRLNATNGDVKEVEAFGLARADRSGKITKIIGLFREVPRETVASNA